MNENKSYAKINLSLKILRKREDSYHELDSIFHKISLCDFIYFEPKNNGIEIITSGEFRKIPTNSQNSCYKAAYELQKKYGIQKGIKITIEKNIPTMSGMGGGSSNAACVLNFLNKFWGINVDLDHLVSIGKTIGADVPFFVSDLNCAKVTGIGEFFEKAGSQYSGKYIALFKEKFIDVNTKWAYEEFDNFVGKKQESVNDFEEVVFSYFPNLQVIKSHFMKSGALQANMTGSGSTIFGIFEKEELAKKALDSLNYEGWGGVFTLL